MHWDRFLNYVVTGGLVGVYAARYTDVPLVGLCYAIAILGLIALKLKRVLPIVCIFIGVGLGMWRSVPILDDHAQLSELIGQKISLEATIMDDPVYHESGQFEFNANTLRFENRDYFATVRVRGFVRDVQRGDRIRVSGTLRDGFASWQASIYYADIEVQSRDASLLQSIRKNFIAAIYSALPDPESSLGLGFLMGIRTLLPESLDNQLSITGLTHIVAVSGYNLTILANTAKRLFWRLSRVTAVVGTLGFLFAFVTITGMSPSILRALIVSGLTIGAWYYGRAMNPWVLLLYSSALSALINPTYAWSSIGWYLSLSAFFGVLVLAPLLQKRIYRRRHAGMFGQIVIETSAAQIVTMPIIMLIFGEVSVIALVANAVVLPFIPLSMLATFVVGLVSLMSVSLAGLVVVFSYIILQYITSVIAYLSNLDWALVAVNITVPQLIALYACIALIYIALRKHHIRFAIIKPRLSEGDFRHGRTFKVGENQATESRQ